MKAIKLLAIPLITCALLLWSAHYFFSDEIIAMDSAARKDAPGQFVELADGITHYQLSGPEDGEVVVLVPGATLPAWVWKGVDEVLAKEGYRVLTYDLFGRGYSDRPDVVYDMELHYRQLRELIQKKAPGKKVHFVTLALGALFSSEYITRHPDAVRSMLVIGADGFGLEAKTSSRILLALPEPVRNYIFSVAGSKILLNRLPGYSRDEKVVKELRALYEPTLKWIGFKRAILSTVLNMPITDAQSLFGKVSKSGVPVMLAWGGQDPVTPYPGEKVVRQSFPDAEVRILKGLGHLPHYENLDVTVSMILGFLKHTEKKL